MGGFFDGIGLAWERLPNNSVTLGLTLHPSAAHYGMHEQSTPG
jgi:hypothetical protein